MTAPTEGQVMLLLGVGLSAAEIGRRFDVSSATVRSRIKKIRAHARRHGIGESLFRYCGREIEICCKPERTHRIDAWLFIPLDDVRG